jgi:hypothetical protein
MHESGSVGIHTRMGAWHAPTEASLGRMNGF